MSEPGAANGARSLSDVTGERDTDAVADELVAVAVVVKTRGLRGEVVANLLTDFPDRFDGLARLIVVRANAAPRWLALEGFWFHGNRVVLKFVGYDSPEAAEALVGSELAVPESEAVKLEADEFYDWQLEGCRVEMADGTEIGHVHNVLHIGGSAPILAIRPKDSTDIADSHGGREFLIPLVESICISIDIESRLIRVDPPEGLLDT